MDTKPVQRRCAWMIQDVAEDKIIENIKKVCCSTVCVPANVQNLLCRYMEVRVCHSHYVGKTDKKADCWRVWVSVVRLFVCSLMVGCRFHIWPVRPVSHMSLFPSLMAIFAMFCCRQHMTCDIGSIVYSHFIFQVTSYSVTFGYELWTGMIELEELCEKPRWDRY